MIRRAVIPPSFACLQIICILNGLIIPICWHTGVTALRIKINVSQGLYGFPRKGIIIGLFLIFHRKSSFVAFSCPL